MSYVSSYHHCVFSTKERRPLITPGLQERLWPYLGGIAREHKMTALEVRRPFGTEQILARSHPTLKGWAIVASPFGRSAFAGVCCGIPLGFSF